MRTAHCATSTCEAMMPHAKAPAATLAKTIEWGTLHAPIIRCTHLVEIGMTWTQQVVIS